MAEDTILHLKPAPGRKVRHLTGAPLKDEGESVPETTYWLRRLNDGDVVEFTPAEAPASKPVKA